MTRKKKSNSQDAPNLRRFRSEIQNLTKSNRHFPRPGPKQTRKERRKEARLEKKSRKNAYFRRLPVPSKEELEKAKLESEEKQKEEFKKNKKEREKQKKKARLRRRKEMVEESRAEQSKIESMQDDKEIRDLEKKLGLNKRKKKDTLPASFKNDGLDYIFDVLDSEKLQAMSGIDEEKEGDDYGLGADDSEIEDDDDENLQEDEDMDKYFDDEDEDSEDDDDDQEEDLDESEEEESEEDITAINKPSETVLQSETKSAKSTDPKQLDLEPCTKKEKWEELADRIKELTEKRSKKKGVTFADEIEDIKIFKKSGRDIEESSDPVEEDSDDNVEEEEEDVMSEDVDEEEEGEELGYEDIDASDNNSSEEEEKSLEEIESDVDNDDSSSASDGTLEKEISDNTDFQEQKTAKRKHKSDIEEIELTEDIYGRLRDSQGNIVRDNKPAGGEGAYVPPAKRLQLLQEGDEKKRFQLERLKKQLKGLVNRASENNMQPISSQIEELYLSNSRADVTESLVHLISESCITPVLTPERLSMELMMLVAILHGNVGSEVGAVFLQHFASQFDQLSREPEYGAGKQMDNVMMLIAHLYNFKVVHSILIFDILKKLTENFQEKDIELILLLLKNVGFSLRKDNPVELKDFIVKVQARAGAPDAQTDQSRVRFMLEVILAIRNNNMRKIPNYDPEHLEHLRKLIRQYIRGSFGDNQLHISLVDLLNADKKGKWWLVGSAWEGTSPLHSPGAGKGGSVLGKLEVSSKLQALARKQRMNTDLRRNIFYVIMTSEDYLDAFEKLLRLGLKSSQQQEIILVILNCCLQEKTYNPFYPYLCQKFCEHHRTYQMALQFCVWDKFKEIGNLSEPNRNNFAKLLAHLIINKAASLSLLKVITFGTLEKAMVRMLKQLLSELLLDHPVPEMEAAFTRIAQIDKLKPLCEGLRLFIRHFLVGKKSETKSTKLVERVEIADRILSHGKSVVLL